MIEKHIVHNGFGVKESTSLIFNPSDDLLADYQMNIDAKIIYNVLRTYLPASTYFELIILMKGNPLRNETRK